jgi:hypothetical protein
VIWWTGGDARIARGAENAGRIELITACGALPSIVGEVRAFNWALGCARSRIDVFVCVAAASHASIAGARAKPGRNKLTAACNTLARDVVGIWAGGCPGKRFRTCACRVPSILLACAVAVQLVPIRALFAPPVLLRARQAVLVVPRATDSVQALGAPAVRVIRVLDRVARAPRQQQRRAVPTNRQVEALRAFMALQRFVALGAVPRAWHARFHRVAPEPLRARAAVRVVLSFFVLVLSQPVPPRALVAHGGRRAATQATPVFALQAPEQRTSDLVPHFVIARLAPLAHTDVRIALAAAIKRSEAHAAGLGVRVVAVPREARRARHRLRTANFSRRARRAPASGPVALYAVVLITVVRFKVPTRVAPSARTIDHPVATRCVVPHETAVRAAPVAAPRLAVLSSHVVVQLVIQSEVAVAAEAVVTCGKARAPRLVAQVAHAVGVRVPACKTLEALPVVVAVDAELVGTALRSVDVIGLVVVQVVPFGAMLASRAVVLPTVITVHRNLIAALAAITIGGVWVVTGSTDVVTPRRARGAVLAIPTVHVPGVALVTFRRRAVSAVLTTSVAGGRILRKAVACFAIVAIYAVAVAAVAGGAVGRALHALAGHAADEVVSLCAIVALAWVIREARIVVIAVGVDGFAARICHCEGCSQ